MPPGQREPGRSNTQPSLHFLAEYCMVFSVIGSIFSWSESASAMLGYNPVLRSARLIFSGQNRGPYKRAAL